MDNLVTIGLAVVVTAVLTAMLVLIFRAANRLQDRLTSLFGNRHWRFSTRYPAALIEKHRWLKLVGIYNPADPHPPRLQQVHVTLREVAAGSPHGPRLVWTEAFQPGEKRLVILGSPGAGKSTLLDSLILVFTGHLPYSLHSLRTRLGEPFPLFARLRELGSEGGAVSLQALLAQAAPVEKVPPGFPGRRLRKGGCLVLLDGLDEVLEERRAWAVEEIEKLAGEYPDNYYVITCRTSDWHNQLPGFHTYEVQPFTKDDIRRFIGGWYSEVLRARAAESEALAKAMAQTGELWRLLADRADLLQIARTPLVLSLITLLHFHRQTDFPKGWAKLYERCVEVLEDLWNRQDQQLPLHEKRMVLEAIAFHLLKEDRQEEEEMAGFALTEKVGLGADLDAARILRLAGESADLGVRIHALRTLGGLKIPFDAEVRQVLEKARREREPALKNAAAWAWCELGRPEDLGLVKVPAGEFLMGSVEEQYEIPSNEGPQHMLYLPAFYIGRYPVTVGEFSEFLASSGHKLEKESRFRKGNQHEDHPVVRVSWADAVEYARWHGMSLPSEAEWEKAARGTDGRRYPWGNEWKPGHANTLENWPSQGKATTTPVGSFSPQGDSPYGCGDMAGNVWEWTRCLAGPYPYDPADGREDLRGSLTGWQMVRGGALDHDARYARCAVRLCDDFRAPLRYLGFRVVLIPFPSDL